MSLWVGDIGGVISALIGAATNTVIYERAVPFKPTVFLVSWHSGKHGNKMDTLFTAPDLIIDALKVHIFRPL